MTIAITVGSWFSKLYIHSQNETDSILNSSLGIAVLLDGRASISLLINPFFEDHSNVQGL